MATHFTIDRVLPLICAALWLCACGGGNSCKRACRKVETCLAQQSSGVDDGTSPIGFAAGGLQCDAIEICGEKDGCQASCLLQASCDELLGGGSSTIATCVAQCASVGTDPRTTGDTGLLKPVGGDSGPSCVPDCYGKQCGDDGCGESCGGCGYDESCSWGVCVSSCVPDCYGMQCGDDGCGGSCGSCGYDESCSSYGACVPVTSATNSGALCSQSTSCTGSEACMQFDQYAQNGMCLGTCSTVGDLCSASGSQLSVCALTAQGGTQYYCAFVCEVQGTSYPCPNSYDYKCDIFDTSQPDIKLCMPK